MKRCYVLGCRSGRAGGKKEWTTTFPVKNPERCREWVRRAGNIALVRCSYHDLGKNRYMCAIHFEDEQFMDPIRKHRLNRNALPTKFDVPPLSEEVMNSFSLDPKCIVQKKSNENESLPKDVFIQIDEATVKKCVQKCSESLMYDLGVPEWTFPVKALTEVIEQEHLQKHVSLDQGESLPEEAITLPICSSNILKSVANIPSTSGIRTEVESCIMLINCIHHDHTYTFAPREGRGRKEFLQIKEKFMEKFDKQERRKIKPGMPEWCKDRRDDTEDLYKNYQNQFAYHDNPLNNSSLSKEYGVTSDSGAVKLQDQENQALVSVSPSTSSQIPPPCVLPTQITASPVRVSSSPSPIPSPTPSPTPSPILSPNPSPIPTPIPSPIPPLSPSPHQISSNKTQDFFSTCKPTSLKLIQYVRPDHTYSQVDSSSDDELEDEWEVENLVLYCTPNDRT